MKNKDLFWCLGTALLVLVLNLLIFGFDVINSDANLTLNVHDTYFVIAKYHLALLLSLFVFFAIYLVRTLHYSFKNLIANLILMLSTLLLILILIGIRPILDTLII